MIDHPARGTDNHVHAAAQGRQLQAIGLATVDRQHAEAGHRGRIGLEGLSHLDGQLAGRRQHQHLRLVRSQVDIGQHRQREGAGLAGTGLRLTEHVTAFQHRRNGGGLDRRRGFIANRGHCAHDSVRQAKVCKTQGGGFLRHWGNSGEHRYRDGNGRDKAHGCALRGIGQDKRSGQVNNQALPLHAGSTVRPKV